MRKTADTKNKEFSLPDILINCFINALISFAVFTVVSLIINAMSAKSLYIKDNSNIILFGILGISCIINGSLNALRLRIKALISASASALFFVTLLLIMFSIVNGFDFGINSVISVVISFVITVVSAIIFKNMRR